jgi:hypothetical protein
MIINTLECIYGNMRYKRTKINESVLLLESQTTSLGKDLIEMHDQMVKILEDCHQVWKLNAKFLVTWGASLGGLILPLKNWIETNHPELTYEQVILLLLGVASNFFYDNEVFIKKVLKKIHQEGLVDVFKKVFKKTKELKKSLEELLMGLKNFTINMSSIVSYAFILPILSDLINMVGEGDFEENVKLITTRILASGVVLISGVSLANLLTEVFKSFQKTSL